MSSSSKLETIPCSDLIWHSCIFLLAFEKLIPNFTLDCADQLPFRSFCPKYISFLQKMSSFNTIIFQNGPKFTTWCPLMLCLFWITGCTVALSTRSISIGESSCEMLPSTIHISKEVTDENGQLVRTCEGDLAVNKCEGTCTSQLQPSVVKASGFLKDCQCCRETHLREREVVLRRCYDADGQSLSGELAHLSIRLKEPATCKCFKCGEE